MKVDQIINNYEKEIELDFKKLISFNTVKDESDSKYLFGKGNNDALNWILRRCCQEGGKVKKLGQYGGYADFGEGDKTIGIFTHLDVMPFGTGWNSDPLTLILKDGKYIGRGTNDDKGPAIASLYAVKAILESGKKLNSKIRLFFGVDEENTMKCIDKYIEKERQPDVTIVPDSDYPVTSYQKGLLNFDIGKTITRINKDICLKKFEGGEKTGIVPDKCRIELNANKNSQDCIISLLKEFIKNNKGSVLASAKGNTIIVETIGKAAHASVPETGKNAVNLMFKFLSKINLGDDLNKFVEFYNRKFGKDTNGYSLDIVTKDETGELTLNVGKVRYENNSINIQSTIRYPRSINDEKIIKALHNTCVVNKTKLNVFTKIKPLNLPNDSVIVKSILGVYNDFKKTNAKPTSNGYINYANKLDNAVGFGVNLPGQEKTAHQANEYITKQNFIDTIKLLSRAVCALDSSMKPRKYEEHSAVAIIREVKKTKERVLETVA